MLTWMFDGYAAEHRSHFGYKDSEQVIRWHRVDSLVTPHSSNQTQHFVSFRIDSLICNNAITIGPKIAACIP